MFTDDTSVASPPLGNVVRADPTAANGQGTAGPPRVPFCLSLGVTGHRSEALPNHDLRPVGTRIAELLLAIKQAVERLLAADGEFFAAGPPSLRFVSPLAEGADQIAAEAALAAGFKLQAVLPFARQQYEEHFDQDALARFRSLLASSSSVMELPGESDRPLDAFVMAGRATLAHCDILLAVWDGRPARGRGGTGEIVQHALRRRAPVIHLSVDPDLPARLIFGGFDPLVKHERLEELPSRICDAAGLDLLLTSLLSPPSELEERRFLAAFETERERRRRYRIEYPLLLAVAGVRPLHSSAWRSPTYRDIRAEEWARFCETCDEARHPVSQGSALLHESYCWSDQLALHFAQTYRSGHIFNFAMAGLVVVLALSVIVVPQLKIAITILELAMISTIIANTRLGTKREWHRRWLDYRQLAERLRSMRSLEPLGIARPGFAAAARAQGKRRWFDWYAAAVWRAMEMPHGRIDVAQVSDIVRILIAADINPQVEWHRASALHGDHLDHRLHIAGMAVFATSIATSALFLIGWYLWRDWTSTYRDWFVFVSGALPALGTAIFGIRVQGEFKATAVRSQATANRLEAIVQELKVPSLSLTRAANLLEEAGRTMLLDLGEWRLAHQQRQLVIPA